MRKEDKDSLFSHERVAIVGYKRGKTREELKKPKPEKKKDREDKRKKKKLARLEREKQL